MYPTYKNSSHNSALKKTNNLTKKWSNDLNRYFSKKGNADGQEAHKKLLNITNYQRNTNQNHNEISPHICQMDIITKSTSNKCWRGCGERGILQHYLWECKLVQPLWKIIWRVLKKLKIELPYYPAVPLEYISRKKHTFKLFHC